MKSGMQVHIICTQGYGLWTNAGAEVCDPRVANSQTWMRISVQQYLCMCGCGQWQCDGQCVQGQQGKRISTACVKGSKSSVGGLELLAYVRL